MAYFYVEVKEDNIKGYMYASSYYVAHDFLEYKFQNKTIKVELFEYKKHGRLDDYLPVA